MRNSIFLKLTVIAGLLLLLLIPLGMLRGLIRERTGLRDLATQEVSTVWGAGQTLSGPVLTVPFTVYGRDDKGKPISWTHQARFLPESLSVDGRLEPSRRTRGIFEVAVYRAELRLSGTFKRPSFAAWNVADQDVHWNDASFAMGVTDLRGIRKSVVLSWAGKDLELAPGEDGLWTSGFGARLPSLATGDETTLYAFSFDFGINGTKELRFLPVGRQTSVKVASPWPSPSFAGAFLPESRTVTGTGFDALWNVSWFGRSYPQQWYSDDAAQLAKMDGSAFGVDLYLPVDAYQKTERSVKYGVLFLVLTFLTFYLFEVFNPFSLHPVQYLLVGFGLCLFYLLLLSLSEHLPFWTAYASGAAATVLLIGGYSAAILKGKLRALTMTGVLGFLYGYLYVLLQAEDYALLLGSLFLFAVLAAVMYLTRKIDWSAGKGRDLPPPAPPPAAEAVPLP